MSVMKNYEDIVVELDIADSALTVSEVIPILEGFQGMACSLNTSLNKVYTCGYEDVSSHYHRVLEEQKIKFELYLL